MRRTKPAATVAGVLGKDPTLPNVPIIIGGKERFLVFDFNVISKIEHETGLNPLRSSVNAGSPTHFRTWLWASLLRDEPELTLEQVGSWITPLNYVGLRMSLEKAWFASVETGEKKKEAAAPGEATAQA